MQLRLFSYRLLHTAARRQGKVDGMKTIAIRLEDETSELLTLVAQLEGTSQIEQIREAITSHLERKVAGGDLTARAQEALDDVEREASAKRKAIEQLVGDVAKKVGQTKPAGRRQRPKPEAAASSGEPKAKAFPMGFAPTRKKARSSGAPIAGLGGSFVEISSTSIDPPAQH